MPLTPENIFYADNSTEMSVADITAAMANSIDQQVTRLESAGIVANDEARDALYTNPVQGNTVFNVDKGIRQTYFAAWNASTNPAGRGLTAGWRDETRFFIQSAEPGAANGVTPRAGDIWLW